MRIVPPTAENLRIAGEALRRGELVGMPTETVYGLAADALNPDAVRRTFEAKGRPAENPLIVHLADVGDLDRVAAAVPSSAAALAARFWPGPLTLVLPKRVEVPDVVTGGLDSVAVRVPAHPIARALIRAAERPLSAPSANPFMGLSPTRAEDVDPSLAPHLALILDGGPCEVGLESTVVDARGPVVRLLRPGQISRGEIEAAVGAVVLDPEEAIRRAPGQYARHYAPRTPVRLAERLKSDEAGITFDLPANVDQIQLSREPGRYGASLYAALHALDRRGLPEIVVVKPPDGAEWEAVWDRLRKAVG